MFKKEIFRAGEGFGGGFNFKKGPHEWHIHCTKCKCPKTRKEGFGAPEEFLANRKHSAGFREKENFKKGGVFLQPLGFPNGNGMRGYGFFCWIPKKARIGFHLGDGVDSPKGNSSGEKTPKLKAILRKKLYMPPG